MKGLVITLSILGVAAMLNGQQYGAPNQQPNSNSSVYNENPTVPGSTNNIQPGYFGPAVYPNWNPGNPGMVDDQDQIFKENQK